MNVIHTSGPMFDGRADLAAAEFCEESARSIGHEGEDMVHTQLRSVLRHPTGRLESHIHVVHHHQDDVISDGDIIYGNWIEGVGERNRTTRFKGYFTFRKVAQRLDAKATAIAERILPRFLNRMS